ncbi:MAG: hypothetical protein EA409_05660 [Saprospirales bacterium]|nr:MAG: hypothetical protein EA409_05660 [Saprospirales bacterium]
METWLFTPKRLIVRANISSGNQSITNTYRFVRFCLEISEFSCSGNDVHALSSSGNRQALLLS